jgi:hypothetical protein
MKLAVVTLCEGELYEKVAEISHPTIRAYAKKIGAIFHTIKGQGNHISMGWRKLDLPAMLRDFDRVLYVDTDILISPDAPNIFDIVPPTHVGLFDEGQLVDRRPAKQALSQNPAFCGDTTYYNTGVMVFSKQHVNELFFAPAKEVDNFYEQTHLNFNIHRFNIPVAKLPYRFNRMLMVGPITGEVRLDSFFLHFAGQFSHTDKTIIDMTLSVMAEDVETWARGDWSKARNIYVEVGGGLGDVVANEPVVRYLAETLYKGDHVVVKTDYPAVFTHLEAIVLGPGQTTADLGHYRINLLPKPGDISENLITHSLCHPTDYASIMAFRGQLPPSKKTIRLYAKEMQLSFKKTPVAVHAGRGWPSKTFPRQWWQDVIDGLISYGLLPVLIGHTSADGTQGTVKGLSAEGCFDLREQLSLPELFGIIKQCPVLLTNDSAPLHIAGAFDNFICYLATCKAWHLIAPYRHQSQLYKTKNLAKGLIPRRSEPNQLDPVRLDHCSEEELAACLPSPGEVASEIAMVASHEVGA